MSQPSSSRFHPVCAVDDLWAGEMQAFSVDGTMVLLLRTNDGSIKAVQHRCPHQGHPLDEGDFDDDSLICAAHLWEFDVHTGCSINPDDAKLALYPVEERDGTIYVSVDGIEPLHSHA